MLAYLTCRAPDLNMAKRHDLLIIVCIFTLHGLTKAFELEGYDGNIKHKLFTEESCLSIVATEMETYQGDITPFT